MCGTIGARVTRVHLCHLGAFLFWSLQTSGNFFPFFLPPSFLQLQAKTVCLCCTEIHYRYLLTTIAAHDNTDIISNVPTFVSFTSFVMFTCCEQKQVWKWCPVVAEESQKAEIPTPQAIWGPAAWTRVSLPQRWSTFFPLSFFYQSQRENPNSLVLKKRQTKMLARVKTSKMKASPSEITSGCAFVEAETWRSNQDQDKDYSSHAGTRDDTAPAKAKPNTSNSLSKQLKHNSQTESDFFFCLTQRGAEDFSWAFETNNIQIMKQWRSQNQTGHLGWNVLLMSRSGNSQQKVT